MFIGREQELKTLNDRYNSGRFEFLPIYGRRRVGKTALIKEFIKDKRSIFFTATESGENQNLRGLSAAIVETVSGVVADISYSGFESAFKVVYEYAKREKLVFVIDEYPYLAESCTAISSVLQVFIDHKLKETDLFIILCGSSMSFMEYQVLGYKSPLYGRRTGQLKIEPFGFEGSSRFFDRVSKEDQAIAYGITGGIPKYLEMLDHECSLKDNIVNSFLRADAMLFEEPSNLLKQELREPQTYNDILTAIANGASKMNEIVTKANITGFDSSRCNKYLTSLISLGIVKKEHPAFAARSKKSIYRIKDGMFRFWYRFVQQNVTKIHLGLGEDVFKQIEPQISAYMGEVFEDICIQWLWKEYAKGNLPVHFQDCGRWWGTNPQTKTEQEIDILAVDPTGSKAIFCECKWTNEKVGVNVLDSLLAKSDAFGYEEKYYMFFSKSGYTDAVAAKANSRIHLVEFKDM